MRILFFTHYFPPEGNAPASRTHENCRRWVRRGHQVTVITCAPSHPDGVVYPGYRNRLWHRSRVDGIDVLRVFTFIAANRGTLLRICNYVSYMISASFAALFLPRPDVILATAPQFFCGWAGVIVSRLRRRPLLLEIRDIWPESIVAVGALRNRRLLRILEWLELRMYAAARHIVTVGEGYRERLLARGVAPERISIVMNGIDRETFHPRPPDEPLRAELGLADRFIVGYTGTIGMASGLDVALRAARLLQERGRTEVVLLLVGDGAVRRELEQAARGAGLDQVVFVGRQDKSRMPAFLSICDACLVHLKKTDLFTTVLPSKLFEAAGMGRPIVLGVAGQAARIVEDAGCGICIEPENERELVDAIERLADDPGLRQRMGRAGAEYVSRRHDRDRLAQDYLEIIEGVDP